MLLLLVARAAWLSPPPPLRPRPRPRACSVLAAPLPFAPAERRCTAEPLRFAALRDETASRFPSGAHMLSGVQQGRLLHALVRLSRATRVLELGSFTGYASLWLAEGLPAAGKLLCVERDARCAAVAARHLAGAGVRARVELRVGEAADALRRLAAEEPFDVVFVDADKRRAAEYCEALLARGLLAEHAVLLVDNVLWKGRVLERLSDDAVLAGSDAAKGLPLLPLAATDARLDGAQARRSLELRDVLHAFNEQLAADERVHQILLPLRDGLSGEPEPLRALRESAGGGGGVQRGRLLHMLVRLGRASRVLEVGGATAYDAAWMAAALADGGRLVRLAAGAREAEEAERQLAAAGVAARAEVRRGEWRGALAALHAAGHASFELVVYSLAPAREAPLGARELLALLAPHGVLVVTQPAPAGGEGGGSGDGRADGWFEELLADAELSVVTLPSPDGDGALVTLVCTLGPVQPRAPSDGAYVAAEVQMRVGGKRHEQSRRTQTVRRKRDWTIIYS
ncbi:hypothetical protein AB1Y20_018993 [Prymnesium parvum]|uniref:Caffeoyl-CoA O-methyltransferase n=1 Tax=Prymnesium parvum TaxID=97485 RepID=A0AB34JSU7_PRYPA